MVKLWQENGGSTQTNLTLVCVCTYSCEQVCRLLYLLVGGAYGGVNRVQATLVGGVGGHEVRIIILKSIRIHLVPRSKIYTIIIIHW